MRNAIARFDQVEGVSDAERDKAWKRILAAAKRYDVEVSQSDWRELAKGGRDRKRKAEAGGPWEQEVSCDESCGVSGSAE